MAIHGLSLLGSSITLSASEKPRRWRISAAALNKVNNCSTCKGKGALECKGCKVYRCFDCQGFGYVSCPRCGKGGLTPEQRGERASWHGELWRAHGAGKDLSDCGEESGWVAARTNCPHLRGCIAIATDLPRFDAPCASCGDHRENWVCLSCQNVLCGRFINGHMLSHHHQCGHSTALSYRDLSVWCFSCDSYLDAQVINELRPVFDTAHLMKFGTPAPLRG